MKHLLSVLLEATSPGDIGTIGISIRGSEVLRRCLICNATFEQTDEGFASLRDHEFEVHEGARHFDWSELHGKTVTIAVVQREGETYSAGKYIDKELMARDEDGVYYLLPRPDGQGWGSPGGGFKWKPRAAESNLLRLMQPAQEQPSSG